MELARTPVAVVCAGCKSILDIGKTLEFLETQGVPVMGFGTDEFPAFFARTSGFKLDHRFDTPEAIAEVIRIRAPARLGERHPDRQPDSGERMRSTRRRWKRGSRRRVREAEKAGRRAEGGDAVPPEAHSTR